LRRLTVWRISFFLRGGEIVTIIKNNEG